MRFLARLVLNVLAIIIAAWLLPGLHITSPLSALLAGVLLGFVNAIVRPVLFFLTLPLTLLTLGLFIFVINALLFWLVAELVGGFHVAGFWAALVGSVLFSVITLVTSWIVFGSRK